MVYNGQNPIKMDDFWGAPPPILRTIHISDPMQLSSWLKGTRGQALGRHEPLLEP